MGSPWSWSAWEKEDHALWSGEREGHARLTLGFTLTIHRVYTRIRKWPCRTPLAEIVPVAPSNHCPAVRETFFSLSLSLSRGFSLVFLEQTEWNVWQSPKSFENPATYRDTSVINRPAKTFVSPPLPQMSHKQTLREKSLQNGFHGNREISRFSIWQNESHYLSRTPETGDKEGRRRDRLFLSLSLSDVKLYFSATCN